MNINVEKLEYLLNDCECNIGIMVERVLKESNEVSCYSAVAASNYIKCYIDVAREIGADLPFSTIEEYFELNGYSKEEYELFEAKRASESVYYRGVQF